jgi:hypothetical protein
VGIFISKLMFSNIFIKIDKIKIPKKQAHPPQKWSINPAMNFLPNTCCFSFEGFDSLSRDFESLSGSIDSLS